MVTTIVTRPHGFSGEALPFKLADEGQAGPLMPGDFSHTVIDAGQRLETGGFTCPLGRGRPDDDCRRSGRCRHGRFGFYAQVS
jgi:hypothetical protein